MSSLTTQLYEALKTLLTEYEDVLANAYEIYEIRQFDAVDESYAVLTAYRNTIDGTDYQRLYDEAIEASNEAGYGGGTVADTIRDLIKRVKTLENASIKNDPILQEYDKAIEASKKAGCASHYTPEQAIRQLNFLVAYYKDLQPVKDDHA